MGKINVSFIERKFNYFVSVEKVFRQVDAGLDKAKFETSFHQLPHLNTLSGMLRNLVAFRPDPSADIYHITGHCHYMALVLPPERTVLTVHDLGFLHTRSGFRRRVLKRLLLDLPLKRLKYVTAISAATRDEIVRHVPAAAGKIRVIGNPLDPGFHSDSKNEFNTSEPNILQIGTSPNKNVVNLARAAVGSGCRLTLIGRIDEELNRSLNETQIKYEAKDQLDSSGIKAEYERADIVAFCSTYEGFGLPIIEAQAMLTPVVTSDLSPMREVAGVGGAVLCDPSDPASIREAIRRVISEPRLRSDLQAAGQRNIQRFDRERIAAEYQDLYLEMLKGIGR